MDEFRPVFLIQVRQDLGVGSPVKNVPAKLKISTEFPVVVNFSVEYGPDGSVFIGHGLCTAR
jgi:hypothetical protein